MCNVFLSPYFIYSMRLHYLKTKTNIMQFSNTCQYKLVERATHQTLEY